MFSTRSQLTGCLILVSGLALIVVQNAADPSKALDHGQFDKELGDLFDGDGDMKKLVSQYLDEVPVSHKTKKHAQRCIGMGWKFSVQETTTSHMNKTSKNSTLHVNPFKSILAILFKQYRPKKTDKICKKCRPCPEIKETCLPCPKDDCLEKCAPCPLPNYCLPPPKPGDCPPKPICPECSISVVSDTTGFTSSRNVSQTTIRETSSPHHGNSSSSSNSTHSKNPNRPPPDMLNFMRYLSEQQQESSSSETTTTSSNYSSTLHATHSDRKTHGEGKSTTTTSRRPTSTTKESSTSTTTGKPSKSSTTTTGKPSKSSTTSTGHPSTTSTGHPSTTTTGKPSKSSTTTTGHPSTSTTGHPSTTTTGRSHTTGSPKKKKTSTTTRKASGSTMKGGDIGAAKLTSSGLLDTMPGTVKLDSNTSTSISTKTSSSTTKNGQTTTNFTSSSIITTGDFLFEANIKILVKNVTQRDEILKMIENIPQSTGGLEMKLAEQLMAHFGEKKIDKTKRRGSTRSFTYLKARNNVKTILGHVLERFKRKRCKCKTCKTVKNCKDCKKPECPVRKPNHNCAPCPVNVGCPAPKNCTSYPPCKTCEKDNEIDNDGDPKDLDDMDLGHVLQKDELEKDAPCKDGVTCEFQKTCGNAPVNPLTPKKKDSPYMNGGENEIYGEWPSFVSLRINLGGRGEGLCGGVLVSNRHVLTAAHCVHKPTDDGTVGPKMDPKSFTVILGEHNKNKTDEHEEKHKVSEICAAKNFTFDPDHGSRYDFALLTLDKNVTFNDYIQPVCMPYKHQDLKKKPKCWVIGMGATKMRNGPEFAQVVQKMRVERASCKGWGIRHDDRSRHCFTKANAKGDTCGGDSGGPIICLSHNHWTLAGLVSYGSEFCDGSESIGWVAVYTRVQALLKTMNEECKI